MAELTQTDILSIIRHPIGGIRSYLKYNYAKLDPSAFRVTVLTIAHPEASLIPAGTAPVSTRLDLVRGRRPLLRLARRGSALLHSGAFDLLHSQGLTAGFIGCLANTPRRVPHVLTLHETFRNEQFRPPFGRLKKFGLAHTLSRVDRLVVVGEDAFQNLIEFMPLPRSVLPRISIIRNGVAVDHLMKEVNLHQPQLRASCSLNGRDVLLGTLVASCRRRASGCSSMPSRFCVRIRPHSRAL